MLFDDTAAGLMAREQTVTRRVGYEEVRPGDFIDAVSEMWMLNHPGKIVPLAKLVVVSVRAEPLKRLLEEPEYAAKEMKRSCLSRDKSLRAQLAAFVSRHRSTSLSSMVTRIEFAYR